MGVHFWSLASLSALAWLFFEDVDFHPARGRYDGVVLARGPRRRLSPADLAEPRALR